jgi:hypothetical protein
MRSYATVVVLVEGQTELKFVKQLLAPDMSERGVYLTPILLDKPGEKGGDVKFARARNDIGRHLKQRGDTWVTLLVDYYGIRTDWPGYTESKQQPDHIQKAAIVNHATAKRVQELFPDENQERRFIPYVSMYEIEALYFSDPACLAERIGVAPCQIDAILAECKEPEKINDHSTTAPSKRLEALSDRFKKTSTGIAIAEGIGIVKMREKCPLFDSWLMKLESLVGSKDGEE